MSMLAEPRSRQKWSQDPRNTNWSNDKTKFGYQMLTKMGWSEGNGLGQNLSGNTEHVRVKKRGTNLGIGVKKSHDDDWIAHNDDFNALLASLNGKESENPAEKVGSKTNTSKFRYTKFVKSKDLSSASSQDLACIFGQRSNATPASEKPKSDEHSADSDESEEEDASKELSVNTVESSLSMNEYFAQKMAALKQKNTEKCHDTKSENDQELNNNSSEMANKTEEVTKKKKKKKRKVVDDSNSVEEEKNVLGKRKIESEVVLEDGLVVKKKKKKKACQEQVVEIIQEVGATEVVKKKKKKKKEKACSEN